MKIKKETWKVIHNHTGFIIKGYKNKRQLIDKKTGELLSEYMW